MFLSYTVQTRLLMLKCLGCVFNDETLLYFYQALKKYIQSWI